MCPLLQCLVFFPVNFIRKTTECMKMVLFSRRILSKWARLLQWQVFFFFVRPQNVCVVDTFYRTTKSTEPASGITSELLQMVPPFVYSIFNVRYKTGRDYRVEFFSALCDFFSNFFFAKRSPLQVFWYFAANWSFKKLKGSPLSSFRHCETVSKFSFFVFSKVFSEKIPNFFYFLLQFFDILQQTGFSKSWKGPPFYKFKNLALFWALDIAPTSDVPVLLQHSF